MLKAILLDDEENAVEILEVVLAETGGVEVLSTFHHPFQFLKEIERLQQLNQLPDVVFIDIEMPGMSGLEVAGQLREMDDRLQVVFVTAYSEYAVEAFELFSLDYLLKPVSANRVEKTLSRLSRLRALGDPVPPKQEVHVQSLGEFMVHCGSSNERMRWRSGKVKELCAYLIHHAGKAVPTRDLIEALFSEADYEKAKVHFYTSMSYLRKAFKDLGRPDMILKHSNGYLFDTKDLKWDYEEAERLISELSRDQEPDWNAVKNLMDCYRGDYFAAFEQREYVGRRQKLRDNVPGVLHRAKEHCRKEGNLKRAEECLVNILQVAPESEPAAAELIELYMEQGNHAAALQCYQQTRQYLLDEYGVEPGRELLACTEILGIDEL